ncbi:MAG: aminotransferase class III-fold pyridoxal phosphate-dependent enzyme [Desulfobacterales bacterium]|nr:aminotransferase class III-fold pyridoxal phosphate-dependent enzyme [Desulfobacterales bacterium]
MIKHLKDLIRKLLRRIPGYRSIYFRIKIGRTLKSYGVRYLTHNIPEILPAKSVFPARVSLENTGDLTWLKHQVDGRYVALYLRYGEQIIETIPLPAKEVKPGQKMTVYFALKVPAETGSLTLMLEMAEHEVALFRHLGVPPLELTVTISPPANDPNDHLWDMALQYNPWHFQPTRGICRGENNHVYPVIAKSAKGAKLYDVRNIEFTDYIMAWGSILLGYAHDSVQEAIIDTVRQTSPMLPFPHPLELEVSQMLCEDFPSAEMAVFGKNGSDVCTLAARIARGLTGKKVILCCGYHGWQDFWVEQLGFDRTGVPEHTPLLIHSFVYNDIQDFNRLYDRYKNDLAAVMLEPAGPLGSDEIGFAPDANREFLEAVAAAVRKASALLIFDEIVTGYRYPQGSVQKAVRVTPDMTCLGKAIASGMPLAALVGKADIMMQGMPGTRYAPTFKSEIYSFAAAKASINIYRTEPVADYIWDYGLRLKQGINDLCLKYDVNAKCTGTPFRMMPVFLDDDPERLSIKKTLYYQQLLRQKITTYNSIMIPSYAHTREDLQMTLFCVDNALASVAQSEANFKNCLELPFLVDIV